MKKNKKIPKNDEKITNIMRKIFVLMLIVFVLMLIIVLLIPFKIVIPKVSCESNELTKIGTIEKRDVYSYCTNKVIVFPHMNKNMSTKTFLKGTIQTKFIWDGGTSFNQGINYVIIDCTDNLRSPRTSSIIVTTKKYEDEAVRQCKLK